MNLLQVLEKYDTVLLDTISSDKVDETLNLRLPQSVIIQEIISALSSQSYISNKILYAKPPTYAILNLILQSPGYEIEVEDFRIKVLDYVKELSVKASQHRHIQEKHPQLYIKIIKKAWENDGWIDKSEGHILEVVKQELGISDREHFTLIHDESIISLWDMSQEYHQARNFLLSTGIILTHENKYLVADEVAIQVKRTFGIEMMDDSFKRLLNSLTREELTLVLNNYQLNISGVKEAMVQRLLDSSVSPSDILKLFHLDNLRDLCRRENIMIGGAKNVVINNIIQFFGEDKDLDVIEPEIEEPVLPAEPETREMDHGIYEKVLMSLTGQQLYDILYQSTLMTSGTKEEKVKRVLESFLNEQSVFNLLRKEDLAQLCRRFILPTSGSKQELVDRVLNYIPPPPSQDNQINVDTAVEIIDKKDEKPKEEVSEIRVEQISLPINWEKVNSLFGDFNHDEKIILAILEEAKTITESDVERIANKYNLGWSLHKAHMAELMAKLKREKKQYIQIKSVQNTNVYQWSTSQTDEQIVEKRSARDIIDALRHGVVPRNNLNLLMVGQQTARDHLSSILLEVNSIKSHFKFIRGQYGSGKTFLCSWLKEFALDNEFAVSSMNISHDQPLSDLSIFFSGMINGLRTPEKSDSSALVDILESWLLNIQSRTAKIEGLDITNSGNQKDLKKIVEKQIEVELATLNDIEPGFSLALRAFYEGKVSSDMELVSNAVAWITGSRSLSAQALRQLGVKGYLESNNVFPRMRAILEVISGARYKGLLLLVDELELVRKFPHVRQREQAFETLRLLIDEAGRNALPGCFIIFTGTDEFFEDERYGMKSYEALAERVMTPFTHESFVSMRQPIISLESLDRERLLNVLIKIRDLYGVAYNCDPKQFAEDVSITKLIEEWTMFGDESINRKPRPILREFIQMLDLCEENKGVRLSEFLKKPQQTEVLVNTINAN